MIIYLQMLEIPEEKSKFEQIYLEYRDLMFYIANQILHNQSDSEDVVHEAFLRVIKIIDKIEEAKCPKTKNLVVIITDRIAIDRYRLQFISLDEEGMDVFSTKDTENMEIHSSLALAMASLPEKYRAVLMLRYDNGFSEAEVAQILSMSMANVHKTVQRAKKKLEEILEEQEV